MNIAGYDAWRLQGPDEPHEIGIQEGQPCNRFPEPDEDAPRGYRPRRCKGVMSQVHDSNLGETWIECDACGELAE